jgi:hypothetical protein
VSYYIAQNQSGHLPQSYPFNVPISGDVTLAFAGTCWSTVANTLAGIIVSLDGVPVAKVPLFFNAASQHLALPTTFAPINLSEGNHTVTLEAMTPSTTTDSNDYFSLWIIEG